MKRNLKDDLFVAVTESKKIQSKDGLQISFEKHKIFLYKEDFEKFMEGMQDVISYIKNSNLKKSAEDVVEPEEEETIHGDSPEEDMASGAIKLDIEFNVTRREKITGCFTHGEKQPVMC